MFPITAAPQEIACQICAGATVCHDRTLRRFRHGYAWHIGVLWIELFLPRQRCKGCGFTFTFDYGLGLVRSSTESFRREITKRCHLGELNYLIVKRIFELIVSRLNRAARRKLKLKKELLVIDSTTITVGKSRLPWALYHGERSGIKLHVSFTNHTGMPLQVVETTGLKNDGPIGVKLENTCFILVADRAYFSIDKVDRYATTKQDFVIRLKENIQLNRKKSLKRTAVVGSNIIADFTCTLGTAQKQTEERHRVVEFTDYEGAIVRVVKFCTGCTHNSLQFKNI